uniref:Uncharacterized protein n=1 Tax=Anguilla anguilla TaxID=7936 RepID=A0A0E9RY20_ANGAN
MCMFSPWLLCAMQVLETKY